MPVHNIAPPSSQHIADREHAGWAADKRAQLAHAASKARNRYRDATRAPSSHWHSFWYGAECAYHGPHTIEGSSPPGPSDYHYRAAMLGYAFGLASLWKAGES